MKNVFVNKRFYFIALAVAIFLDLEITYYGITQLNLDEGNVVGLLILQNYGWYGLIVLYMAMMILFAISLKLVDLKRFVWARYVIGALCAYHLYIPIQNVYTIAMM